MERPSLCILARLTAVVLVTVFSLSSTTAVSGLTSEDVHKPSANESNDDVCGLDFLTADTHVRQQLTFPENVSHYPNNVACFWVIKASFINDYVVHVTFTFFDIEASPGCSSAYVRLELSSTYDSDNSLGNLCGPLMHHEFYTSLPVMIIRFHSNSTQTGRGFRLFYEAVQQSDIPSDVDGVCLRQVLKRVVVYNASDLKYPANSSHYANNADCEWLLEASYWYQVIQVNLTFVDIQGTNCSCDYIELFDGNSENSTSLGRICGSAIRNFQSSGQSMYIKFHSDNSTTGRGFHLVYQAVLDPTYHPSHSSTSLHPAAIFGLVMAGVMLGFLLVKLSSFLAGRRRQSRQQRRGMSGNTNKT